MLQIKNLTITHLRDLRSLTEDFSLCINPGDKAALIGEEGNGKSTLLKLIYDSQLVQNYVEYSGEIVFDGNKMGYLPQEPGEELKNKTVYEFCCSCEGFFEKTPKELADIGRQLGLDISFFYSEQIIGTLSGGERIKLQMAGILMGSPELLLLDEPSNDIDIQTIQWLESFIKGCRVPIIYISHDEMLLENTANMLIHMEQIRRKTIPRVSVNRMGYQEYIANRADLSARQEKIAAMERRNYKKQMEKYRKIQQIVEHQQEVITRQNPHGAALLKKKMHAVKSMEKRFERQTEDFHEFPDSEDAIFIRFHNCRKIPNGKTVLEYETPFLSIEGNILAKDIYLKIQGSKKVCIIGRNGAGKSLLLKKIRDSLKDRNDIRIFYMPQNYEEILDMELSPVDFLTISGDREENIKICTWLGSMKFTPEEMQHKIRRLSGGQKAKLLFLKMVLTPYDLLILDEPTRNISPLSNPVIRKILQEFPGAILSISHDRKYISDVCDTVYELDGTLHISSGW